MSNGGLSKDSLVGEWRLDRELGQGGQAFVWRVRHAAEKHAPPGALKIAKGSSAKDLARFEREAEILATQSHPSIVKVRARGNHNSRPFFVMELASTTLAKVSAGDTPGTRVISESREVLLRLLRQTCEAVAHLHAASILHRDLKPSNVLLMLDPPEPFRAVVSDLGIASFESKQGDLTSQYETIGTPTFRAPEALVGRHSKQSDVYSLGKTIESVINRSSVLQMGAGRCLRDQRLTEDVWDALDALLAKACAYDPANRYADAEALLQEFPTVVLGLDARGAPKVQHQRQSTITLSLNERVLLYELVSRCPSSESSTSVYRAMNESRLADYDFTMSIRRLEELEFVEVLTEREDFNGDPYTATRPTRAGILWAHEHQEEMNEARARERAASTDDVPF